MFCTRCGAEMQADKRFCIKCGAELKMAGYPSGGGGAYAQGDIKKQAGNEAFRVGNEALKNIPSPSVPAKQKPKGDIIGVVIVGLIVVIIAVVAIVGISMASFNIKKRDDLKPRNSGGHGIVLEKREPEEASPSPTPSPSPSQPPVYDDYYFSQGFKAVRDFEYSFVCPYPEEFNVTKDSAGYKFSSDALGIWINLEAKPNTHMFSGTSLLNEYKQSIEASAVDISYSDSGNKWYAISYTGYDGIICYRKCIINDLNMAYFDVSCTDEMLDTASEYINYMEANFKFK